MATIDVRKNRDGSKSFLAQVRLKGFKPVAKAFSTKKDAKAWADALEGELRGHRDTKAVRADVATLTVTQLATAYLADPETRSLKYYSDLERMLAWWVNSYGNERARELGVIKLREARAKLHKGRQTSTVNRYLSALRSCWNWARAAGYVPKDNVWPPRLMLKEPPGRQRYLTDQELADVLAAAKPSLTLHTAIVLSLATGIRQSELLRLRWADIDFAKQSLRVLIAKNKAARVVYLPAVAVETLKELRKAPVVGQHVFLTENGTPAKKDWLGWRWEQIRKEAKLDNFHWHDLRHSCASFLAQNGATLLEIGSVLGHKSPSVTARYAHLVQGAPVTGHTELDSKLRGS